MFNPQTDRLTRLAAIFPERIAELEKVFAKSTNIYLDYANMYHWSEKLHWRINPKRLIQFLHSFPSIKDIRFYQRDKKSVFIFATARRVAVELSQTKAPIYDIQKIRNFICDPGEIQMEAKRTLASP